MASNTAIQGRYEIIRPLSQLPVANVFLVKDLQNDELKVLKLVDAKKHFHTLENEFRNLARARHPHLPLVYDFEETQYNDKVRTKNHPALNHPFFFTSQFIAGVDLFSATRPVDWKRKCSLLLQLCFAVDFLHRNSIIHGDIKPSNVVVRRSDQQVFLVDLGLSSRQTDSHRQRSQISGTLEYLAPEILAGGDGDYRSDLYALGITFFKILNGSLPFPKPCDLEIVVKLHQQGLVLDWSAAQDVPEKIKDFINQCVQRDPWKRPLGLFQIMEVLNETLGNPKEMRPLFPPLGESAFIGHSKEFDHILRGDLPSPRALLLNGSNGCGKSRFLRELAVRAQVKGWKVLQTEGSECSTRPILKRWAELLGFKKSNPPAKSLGREIESNHFLSSWILEKILTPNKNNFFLFAIDNWSKLPQAEMDAIRYFFLHVSQTLERKQVESFPLVILATRNKTPNTNGWPGEQQDLETLSEGESLEIVQSLLGQKKIPEGLENHLWEIAQGNPLLIHMELNHLIQEQKIIRNQGTFQWNEAPVRETRSPKEMEEIFLRHFQSIPEKIQGFLAAVCLLAEPFSLDDIDRLDRRTLHQLKGVDLDVAIDWCCRNGFLTVSGSAQRWTFRSQGLRRYLNEHVSNKTALAIHRCLAKELRKIKAKTISDWLALAHHLKGANEKEEAAMAFLTAVQSPEFQANPSLSVQTLAECLTLLPADATERTSVEISLAKHLVVLARYDEAQKILKSHRHPTTTSSADQHLEALSLLAHIESRRGNYGQATSLYNEFQSHLKSNLTQTDSSRIVHFLGQIACCFIRAGKFEKAENLLKQATATLQAKQDRLAEIVIDCHKGELALQQGFLKPAKQTYRRVLKRLTQSKRRKNLLEGKRLAATAHNNLGRIAAAEGRDTIAIKHFKEGLSVSQEIGNPAEEIISLTHLGNLYYHRNQYDQARDTYEESLALCRLIQKPREESMNLFNLGNISFMTGNLHKALDYHKQALAIVKKMDDPVGVANSCAGVTIVLLEIGDLEGARNQLEAMEKAIGKRDLSYQKAYAKLLKGVHARLSGDLAQAREYFRIAETQFQKMQMIHELAQTHVEWAEMELLDHAVAHALPLAKNALKSAKESGAHDLAIQALLVLAQLEPTNSSEYLKDAQTLAEQCGLRNLLWKVLTTKATFESPHGKASQPGQIGKLLRISRQILEEISVGLSDPLQKIFWADSRHRLGVDRLLVDSKVQTSNIGKVNLEEMTVRFRNEALNRGIGQLEDLFQILKLLNSRTNLEELLDIILDTAVRLLRAQRGLLLLKDDEHHLRVSRARNINQTELDEPQSAFSYTIAVQTIQEKRTIVTSDALADERFCKERSVNHLKLRSVLSVPLRIQDKVLGALYVDNPRRKGIFQEEEVRLLEIVSDQAALALENARLREQLEDKLEVQSAALREAHRHLKARYGYDQIIGGTSKKMQEVFQLVEKIRDSHLPVLIQGESGTGKELIARAIHHNGPFHRGKFIGENCGAIPPELLESILFGHVRGAFTNAHETRKGLFELANGGTLFLDEIDELTPNLQVKLLRVLEDGVIRPVGGSTETQTHVQILSASNRNLAELVESGKFRKDLYYRLRGIDILLPPLRERRDDIPLLVKHFLEKFSQRALKVSPRTAQLLDQYPWPGNIRELRNTLERACALAPSDAIRPEDLPLEIRQTASPDLLKAHLPFLEAKKEFERRYLKELMEEYSGNVTRAAAATGLYRQYLHRLLRKHKLA